MWVGHSLRLRSGLCPTKRGCPILSRSLRKDGDFDFPVHSHHCRRIDAVIKDRMADQSVGGCRAVGRSANWSPPLRRSSKEMHHRNWKLGLEIIITIAQPL